MQTLSIHLGHKMWQLLKSQFKKVRHLEHPRAICALGREQVLQIEGHLLSLSAEDRYLRFGYQAKDEQVQSYVEHIDFSKDKILGIFDHDVNLIALAHLSLARPSKFTRCAEFGVSVLPRFRGQGLGAHLFEHSSMLARNEGVSMLFIHALSENAPMLKIAISHGAKLERFGGETEAFLQLPPRNFGSRLHQWMLTFYGQTDLEIKMQVRQFWHLLDQIQEIRQGVRDGRQVASAWNSNLFKPEAYLDHHQ